METPNRPESQSDRSANLLSRQQIIFLILNVNVRNTYWAPLNPVTEVLHSVELTSFLWLYARRCGRTQLFKLQPSINLHAQLQPLCSADLVPNVLPRRDEGSGKPVQWSKPYGISAPTQDSNPGGRIQNYKRWPLHYHCTTSHLKMNCCM